ncbi:type IV pilin protein [Cupriavidus sp. D384]|uniref:type IV pilin protein n=1 Tax=Cupriavidus sp. D384 TaxID=1538095 RepID=UPI0009EE2707|nr:type IV pilin protein [Cupriavidus sp. D384]
MSAPAPNGIIGSGLGGISRARASSCGFTLVELMVTVAIIGIIAAFVFPSYTSYVVRGNRAAAESYMLELASLQERFMVDNRAYAANLGALNAPATPASVSANYQVTLTAIAAATPPAYTITATPTGNQASRDTSCGTLSLNQAGDKTATGSAQAGCWK